MHTVRLVVFGAVLLVTVAFTPAAGFAEGARPRITFTASSQLVAGQPEPTFYDMNKKGSLEIPIPATLSKDGWYCALSARKVDGGVHSQGVYCLNSTVHSVMQVAVECDSSATDPIVATATLRTDRAANVGIQFMVGCQAAKN
jgi:hypothetical protein